jgi:hypothetical protein
VKSGGARCAAVPRTGSHLMNAIALLGLYGRDVAVTENVAVNGPGPQYDDCDDGSGRCPITGY